MKRVVVKAARDKAEIIRRRDEYQQEYDAQKAQFDSEFKSWRKANSDITSVTENEILTQLGDLVSPLNIEVYAEFNWDDHLRVMVKSNDHNVHDKSKALSWSWEVKLDRKGEIQKESNSWSGLNAVTEEQISSLRMSVEALEILNRIDWATVLNKTAPAWEDYVKTQEPKNLDREFNRELEEADIENAIENNLLIKGLRNTGKMYRGEIYYCVVGESPSQYKVVECPASYVERIINGDPIGLTENGWLVSDPNTIETQFTKVSDIHMWLQNQSEYRITKDKFLQNIARPIQVLED